MNGEGRRIAEGIQHQGEDEEVVYSLTTTKWGSSPSDVIVKAYHINNAYADVSDTVLSGTSGVAGDVITLPKIGNLLEGNRYRIEVKFAVGASVLEAYFIVEAQR